MVLPIFIIILGFFLYVIAATWLCHGFYDDAIQNVKISKIHESDILPLVYGEGPVNENGQVPSIVKYISSSLQNDSYVTSGLVITKNTKMSTHNFTRWGTNNNLTLNKIQIDQNGIDFYELNGTTQNYAAGFESQEFYNTNRYLSLSLGTVIKSSNLQVSLSFQLQGKNGYYSLVYVSGPLSVAGWREHVYYDQIFPNSSKLVDLDELLRPTGDRYVATKLVTIVVQKDAKIDKFEFRADLGKTTVKFPSTLKGGGTYFVRGNISVGDVQTVALKYFINNLGISKIGNFKAKLNSAEYGIADNKWDIITEKKEPSGGNRTVLILAKKSLNPGELNPSIVLQLDLLSTLQYLGPKDALFLTVFVFGALFFYIRSRMSPTEVKNE